MLWESHLLYSFTEYVGCPVCAFFRGLCSIDKWPDVLFFTWFNYSAKPWIGAVWMAVCCVILAPSFCSSLLPSYEDFSSLQSRDCCCIRPSSLWVALLTNVDYKTRFKNSLAWHSGLSAYAIQQSLDCSIEEKSRESTQQLLGRLRFTL